MSFVMTVPEVRRVKSIGPGRAAVTSPEAISEFQNVTATNLRNAKDIHLPKAQ